jgi:hypothetical protein
MSKTNPGNYFEDFRLGQVLSHATPRTVTAGDVALYNALYGPRFALTSSDEFARSCGLPAAPVDVPEGMRRHQAHVSVRALAIAGQHIPEGQGHSVRHARQLLE